MEKLSIAVDMDDVIAATGRRLLELYHDLFGEPLPIEKVKGRSLPEVLTEEQTNVIRAALHEKGFFRHLEVMEDSQRVMKELYHKHEVFIVSAAMEFPYSLEDKYQWLGEHFPFIHWKKIIFCGEKHFLNTDYLIDDHAKNLVHFQGNPLLFTALHNMNQNTYPRVNNWQEVGQLFL